MTNSSSNPNHNRWVPIWEFVIHVFVGAFLFTIVFTPAVWFDFVIHWLEDVQKVSKGLIYIISVAKYLVGGIDVALFFVFMVKMSYELLRKMFQSKMG